MVAVENRVRVGVSVRGAWSLQGLPRTVPENVYPEVFLDTVRSSKHAVLPRNIGILHVREC